MIEETINYCRQRHTFGKPLIENQVIHFKLAELMAEVELLKSLCYRAADQMVAGEDVTYLTSIAKLKAGRLSRIVVDSCIVSVSIYRMLFGNNCCILISNTGAAWAMRRKEVALRVHTVTSVRYRLPVVGTKL